MENLHPAAQVTVIIVIGVCVCVIIFRLITQFINFVNQTGKPKNFKGPEERLESISAVKVKRATKQSSAASDEFLNHKKTVKVLNNTLTGTTSMGTSELYTESYVYEPLGLSGSAGGSGTSGLLGNCGTSRPLLFHGKRYDPETFELINNDEASHFLGGASNIYPVDITKGSKEIERMIKLVNNKKMNLD